MVVRWLRLLLLLPLALLLRFQSVQVKAFFAQVDKNMLMKVDGIGGILFLTDDETFFL